MQDGKPEGVMQTSATRHPSEMKKSWKRNFTHADERNKASQSDEKKLETQLYQLASMVAPMYHKASHCKMQHDRLVHTSL